MAGAFGFAFTPKEMPDLDVDSIHRAFQINLPEAHTYELMASYDLIVVEEVSLVSVWIFERLLRLWNAAAKRPALVFVGDFRQLRNIDGQRVCETPKWRNEVQVRELNVMRRCKCEILKWKLELLRAHAPSKDQLHRIIRGHHAPLLLQHRSADFASRHEPTEDEIGWIFHDNPDTVFVTISRKKAQLVNEMALRHFFRHQPVLQVVDADPASNPDNYPNSNAQEYWVPLRLPIYEGMRVTVTQNVRPEIDYVNGQDGTVRGLGTSSVRVETDTGHMVPVFPWTDQDHGWPTYYPIRPAYATTLMKVQGATLKHMTMWLDVPLVEAAGYVALSRVQHDKDWQYVGWLTQSHFQPAKLR